MQRELRLHDREDEAVTMPALPKGPYFIPRHKCETGGVDFLGLRQANLDLMQFCLPGISNTTQHIRCYSLLCWIHWKFHELVAAKGLEEVSSEELRAYREKIEVLFTWGHKLEGVGGVPGRDANPPSARSGSVPLDFEAWERVYANTSLMAAVQYGPSSKQTGGLGFLEPLDQGVFRTCGLGVKLAEALERRLERARNRKHLNMLGTARGTEQEARALFQHWDIRSLERGERSSFRNAFFSADAIGADSARGRRSATLALVQEVLARAPEGLRVEEVRERMVLLHGLSRVRSDQRLAPAWMRWTILQVRQVQRLGLEGLFRWIQHRVLEYDEHDTDALLTAASKALKKSSPVLLPSESVANAAARVLDGVTDLEVWMQRAKREERLSLAGCVARFGDAMEEDIDQLLPTCLHLLLLVARLTDFVTELPGAKLLLKQGDEARISLWRWNAIVHEFDSEPLRAFVLRLFEREILSQHFFVAARRFDGGVQRLQLAIEEEGLVALTPKTSTPAVTPDRLRSALSLMSECGLAHGREDGSFGPKDA